MPYSDAIYAMKWCHILHTVMLYMPYSDPMPALKRTKTSGAGTSSGRSCHTKHNYREGRHHGMAWHGKDSWGTCSCLMHMHCVDGTDHLVGTLVVA